jgi:hypothetical protein
VTTGFRFGRTGATWSDRRVETEKIAAMRAEFAVSFGSCSFTEPMDDLRSLDIL